MILADRDSDEAAIWQLVESCAYTADLATWSDITDGSTSVLDLGCGIGRVARHLAGPERIVLGIDTDPVLVANLNRLADEGRVSAITGDATRFATMDLGRDRFETIIAPQQLLHILGGEEPRGRLLAGVKQRLEPEGTAAFAISEWIPGESQSVDILPDVREIDDWVYASRPVAVEYDEDGSLTVIRLRQAVAPDGSLEESHDSITLNPMDRDTLALELAEEGLLATGTIDLPETDRHIATVVVIARHAARNT